MLDRSFHLSFFSEISRIDGRLEQNVRALLRKGVFVQGVRGEKGGESSTTLVLYTIHLISILLLGALTG